MRQGDCPDFRLRSGENGTVPFGSGVCWSVMQRHRASWEVTAKTFSRKGARRRDAKREEVIGKLTPVEQFDLPLFSSEPSRLCVFGPWREIPSVMLWLLLVMFQRPGNAASTH